MANEIRVQFQPDETNLYACVFKDDSGTYKVNIAGGDTWEVFDDANIDNYDIPLTESGDESGMFLGDFPSIAAGRYDFTIYQGNKAEGITQLVLGSSDPQGFKWSGTAEVFPNTTVPDAAGIAAGLHATTDGKVDAAQIDLDTITDTGVNIVSEDNIDFGALKKTSLNNATPSVTVSDKTGFSLSTAGILAIWHQLEAAVVTASTMGIKLKNWVLGSDNKSLISTDAQDLSGTLDVNTKTISAGAVDSSAIATDAIDADSLKADAVAEIQSGLAPANEYDVELDAAISTRATSEKQDTMETTLGVVAGDVANIDGDSMRGTDGANTTVPDNTGIAAIEAVTDKLEDTVEDAGGDNYIFTSAALAQAPTAEMDAAELEAAMKAITGITVGGSWTWEKIMKIAAAFIAGNWRVKSSDATVQQLLDAEDGATVILEQSITRSPGAGSNYRDMTVLI